MTDPFIEYMKHYIPIRALYQCPVCGSRQLMRWPAGNMCLECFTVTGVDNCILNEGTSKKNPGKINRIHDNPLGSIVTMPDDKTVLIKNKSIKFEIEPDVIKSLVRLSCPQIEVLIKYIKDVKKHNRSGYKGDRS